MGLNAIISLNGIAAPLWHRVAQVVKRKNNIRWSAYTTDYRADRFFDQHADFYQYCLSDNTMAEWCETSNEEIDFAYLRQKEKEMGVSFWSLYYRDRRLSQSILGMDYATMKLKSLYDRDHLLRIFQHRTKKTEEFLEHVRPDFIVMFSSLSSIGTCLLYYLAKAKGIKVAILDSARLQDLYLFTDRYDDFPKIEQCSAYMKEAEKILDAYTNTGHFPLHYINDLIHTSSRLRTYWNIMRESWEARRLTYHYAASLRHFVWFKVKEKLRPLTDRTHFEKPLPDGKFIFFPLHFEPEVSLLQYAPYWTNQLETLSHIARSLPCDISLVVKEHPVMVPFRTSDYYRQISEHPNVHLVSSKLSAFQIIQKSIGTVTISSTAGWESMLLQKPVLVLGDVFYRHFPWSIPIESPKQFYTLLRELDDWIPPSREVIVKCIANILALKPFHFKFFKYEKHPELLTDKAVDELCDHLISFVL